MSPVSLQMKFKEITKLTGIDFVNLFEPLNASSSAEFSQYQFVVVTLGAFIFTSVPLVHEDTCCYTNMYISYLPIYNHTIQTRLAETRDSLYSTESP